MKIEIDLVREMLNSARAECKRPVDDSNLLADVNDKFFNFGVDHLFHVLYSKTFDVEKIAGGVEQ